MNVLRRNVYFGPESYSQDGSLQYPGNPLRVHPSDGYLPASGEPLTNGSAISSKGETHD